MEIPMLIKRCLTYGVKISPHQLNTVLKQYEVKKVPDDNLAYFNAIQIEKYVNGLYLSGQEMAYDWTKGHEILKGLGFEENKTTEGHRSFVLLTFKP